MTDRPLKDDTVIAHAGNHPARRHGIVNPPHAAPADVPGHALWTRHFCSGSVLFGGVLNPFPKHAVAAMVDGMTLFRLGFSRGVYESLALAVRPETVHSATRWTAPSPTPRLHAGLEDPEDLLADLAAGFERLNAAAGQGQ